MSDIFHSHARNRVLFCYDTSIQDDTGNDNHEYLPNNDLRMQYLYIVQVHSSLI